MKETTLDVWAGRLKMKVAVKGDGPPVVYFHPSGGLCWDAFLDELSGSYTVYAPYFPGTDPDNPYAIRELDDLWDTVLAYEELLRTLGLYRPAAIGQSFGGMLAAEIASTFPDIFSRLVLLDPVGLWNEKMPVADWIGAPLADLPALLFKDPSSPAAQSMLAMPEDPEAQVKARASLVWSLGCAAKFCWPLPDRGLHKRLHRINAPTLIVWGKDDALIPVAYADEFQQRIPESKVVVIPDSGHIPQVEQMPRTHAAVSEFLDALS